MGISRQWAPVLLFAAMAALPARPLADPAVLLFPVVGRPTEVIVTGRVLRDLPDRGSTPLARNLRRLTTRDWEGAPVEVRFAGRTVRCTSGEHGSFAAAFPAPAGHPFPVGGGMAEARVPGAVAQARVDVLSDEAPFLVISDFDDTVAVSGIAEGGFVRAGMMLDGDSHPAVPGMAGFFRCLREGKTPAPGFAFVSGTPVQFLHRLETFLARNRFPPAGLYLRDLGPKTLSGYKQPLLRQLLSHLPHPVILVGDSGEKDPEVYAEIRREFPDRVAAIFIRASLRTERADRFQGMFLFHRAEDAAREASDRGFASPECVAAEFAPSVSSVPEE